MTGATGYLGLHVVNQLLEAGYRVRGYAASLNFDVYLLSPRYTISSARGQKYARLKKVMAANPAFEAVEISDIGSGDFSNVLQGEFASPGV